MLPGNAPPAGAAGDGGKGRGVGKSALLRPDHAGEEKAAASSLQYAASQQQYLHVLPCLFWEYLALALTRSVIPALMVSFFGPWTYFVVGVVETIKGFLAFVACPTFGKLSDVVGRKVCLLMTVVGTTLPVCLMAISVNMWVFVAFQGLSGLFSATFPLTFAYIADFVAPVNRASAYGLALATFGLSFSIGPVAGGYLENIAGAQGVFRVAAVMVAVDVAYIWMLLPESLPKLRDRHEPALFSEVLPRAATEYRPFQWNPLRSLRGFSDSPLLSRVVVIVFLYYTGVWALVSTLMFYVTRRFEFTPVMVGQLLSAFGVCTMFAEGVLVRIFVPRLGEKLTMQIGLLGFAAQCVLIGLASAPWMIFASMCGSLLSNLVYPSISSLVSRSVSIKAQGEVLGAINGVKALTEGLGPLAFGPLMFQFEDTILPGAPYLAAGAVAVAALIHSFGIPDDDEDIMLGAYGIDQEGTEDEMEMTGLLQDERESGGGSSVRG
jgi:DHA1 family tetracycline resistance protein-like MFS transporter